MSDLDRKWLNSMPDRIIEAFRKELYTDKHVKKNPDIFCNRDWVDIDDLQEFCEEHSELLHDAPDMSSIGLNAKSGQQIDASFRAPPYRSQPASYRRYATPESRDTDNVSIIDYDDDNFDPVEIPQSDADAFSDSETTVAPSEHSDDDSADLQIPTSSVPASHTHDEDQILNAEQQDEEELSDTVWLEDNLCPILCDWPHLITRERRVESLEIIHGLASYYPIPRRPRARAYMVDLSAWSDDRFIDKDGEVISIDRLIKSVDQDSWRGTTGGTKDKEMPQVLIDGKWVKCRRSRLFCNGSHACEHVDPKLTNIERFELSPQSLEEVIRVAIQSRVTEADSSEKRALIFYAICHAHPCAAITNDGEPCQGHPELKAFKKSNPSRNGKYSFVACSGWKSNHSDQHQQSSIPPDVDESHLKLLFSNKPLPGFETPATCGNIVSPYIGGRLKTCKYPHRGDGKLAKMKKHDCPVKRWILVPHVPAIRKAIILPDEDGMPHNHPLLPPRKTSRSIRDAYEACVRAFGVVGATVTQVDNAKTTQQILSTHGTEIGEPVIPNRRVREDIVRKVKKTEFPHGLDITGAYNLYRNEQLLPVVNRYIHRYIDSGSSIIIVTANTYLLSLVHQALSLQVDTTFKRTAGKYNEWEVVIWLREVQRAVTIARIYTDAADRKQYHAIFEALDQTIQEVTKRPLRFKRLSKGGTLLAICVDLELAQALGAGDYFLSTNEPEHSGIRDPTATTIIPYIIKACMNHVKRGIKDLKGHLSLDDYGRIQEFPYLKSTKDVDEFSTWLKTLRKTKVNDWWNHKVVNKWILPTIIKSLSKIHSDDWDLISATTNTNESQHAFTNKHTGIQLTLVESIIKAGDLDKETARQIEQSFTNGTLKNHRNDTYTRMSRNIARVTNASIKTREGNETKTALKQLTSQIKELQSTKRKLLDQGKSESSSSGRVNSGGFGGRATRTKRARLDTDPHTEIVENSPPTPTIALDLEPPNSSQIRGSDFHAMDHVAQISCPTPATFDSPLNPIPNQDGTPYLLSDWANLQPFAQWHPETNPLSQNLNLGPLGHYEWMPGSSVAHTYGFLDALNRDDISPYDIDA